jgi:hypothetical protein
VDGHFNWHLKVANFWYSTWPEHSFTTFKQEATNQNMLNGAKQTISQTKDSIFGLDT